MKMTIFVRLMLLIAVGMMLQSSAFAEVLLKPNGSDAMPTYMRSLSADVTIRGQIAESKIVMTFQNESNANTEADFIYTLPAGGVATYFAYWAGKEKVVARVVDKEEAIKVYETIKSMGQRHDPALVELMGKNTFRARIFPILANADLKVEVHIVEVLPSANGDAVYSLSLPNKQLDSMDNLDIKVRVMPDSNIKSVATNYGIPVAKSEDGYSVVLEGKEYSPKKDFQVRLMRGKKPLLIDALAAISPDDSGFFAMSLTPDHSISKPKVTLKGSRDIRIYDICPAAIPNVKAGQSVTIFGRYKGQGKVDFVLSGKGSLRYKGHALLVGSTTSENPASKLWATYRMRDLSRSKSNKSTVTALSHRYGMPSKYTSWLAVPKAEMIGYNREKYGNELAQVAEPLSRIISGQKVEGHTEQELSSKLSALCKKIGDTPQDELRPYLDYCRQQFAKKVAESIASGNDSTPEGKLLGERFDKICTQSGSKPQDEIQHYLRPAFATELANLAANGKYDTAQYQQIDHKLKELPCCNEYESDVDGLVKSAFRVKMSSLAADIVQERNKPNPDSSRTETLEKQLDCLAKITGFDIERYIKSAKESYRSKKDQEDRNYLYEISPKLQELARKGQLNAPSSSELKKEFVSLNTEFYSLGIGKSFIRQAIESIAYDLTELIASGSDTPEKVKMLKDRAKEAAQLTDDDADKIINKYQFDRMVSFVRDSKYVAADSKEFAKRSKDAQHKLLLMQNATGIQIEQVTKVVQGECDISKTENELWNTADKLINVIAEGKGASPEGAELRERCEELCGSLGYKDQDWLKNRLNDSAISLARDLYEQLGRNSPDQTVVKKLRNTLKRFERVLNCDSQFENMAENCVAIGYVRTTISQIDAELDRQLPNTARLARLNKQLAKDLDRFDSNAPKEVCYTNSSNNYYWNVAFSEALFPDIINTGTELTKLAKQIRETRNESDKNALQKRLSSSRTHLQDMKYGFWARFGDPLISVDAPSDAKQVIAIMPDGQIKVLEYNSVSKRWEARFDIPTYVSEGNYTITIVFVSADGGRKSVLIDYNVDLTSPQGFASASTTADGSENLRLELKTDQNTARVVAILPWGERIELNKSAEPGKFFAVVPVPASAKDNDKTVQFVLTDSAHNKTTISVVADK